MVDYRRQPLLPSLLITFEHGWEHSEHTKICPSQLNMIFLCVALSLCFALSDGSGTKHWRGREWRSSANSQFGTFYICIPSAVGCLKEFVNDINLGCRESKRFRCCTCQQQYLYHPDLKFCCLRYATRGNLIGALTNMGGVDTVGAHARGAIACVHVNVVIITT